MHSLAQNFIHNVATATHLMFNVAQWRCSYLHVNHPKLFKPGDVLHLGDQDRALNETSSSPECGSIQRIYGGTDISDWGILNSLSCAHVTWLSRLLRCSYSRAHSERLVCSGVGCFIRGRDGRWAITADLLKPEVSAVQTINAPAMDACSYRSGCSPGAAFAADAVNWARDRWYFRFVF